MKRFLSLFMTFVMILSMLPLSSMAAQVSEDPAEIVTQQIAPQVNPLYADFTDAADLVFPEVSESDASVISESDYVPEMEAAAQIREYLKSRTEVFTVNVQSGNDDYNVLFRDLLDQAMVHTGIPEEGDSLRFQYGGSKGSISYYSDENWNYYSITYTVSYYTTADQETQFNLAVDNLLTELALTGLSDYEKVCGVYDYICDNITYDYDNLEDTSYKLKYTGYAALVNKTAVCQGYAVLLYRLLLELGVDTRVVTGIGNGGGHAWNIVEMDGLYYNADSTWDASWHQAGLEYNFFLRNEENFTEGGTDHIRDAEYSTAEFLAAYPMGETDYVPKTTAVVAEGTCGEALTWVLTDDGVLTISGEGAMYDYQNPPEVANVAPWGELPVTNVVVESGVTNIGICAFRGLAITGVSLPDTIASIGHGAFDICTSLTEIQLPDGLTAIGNGVFSGCPLTELIIPASVSEIGSGIFSGCTQLKKITFPGDAPSIGNYAFSNVTATVYYPANNETWTSDVMQDYGGTITWIAYGPNDFRNLEELKQLIAENQTEYIGAVNYIGTEPLVIGEDLQIPWTMGVGSHVQPVIIPEGVTVQADNLFYATELTINGTMNAIAVEIGDALAVNGELNVSAQVYLYHQDVVFTGEENINFLDSAILCLGYDVTTMEQLMEALGTAEADTNSRHVYSVAITKEMTIDQSLSLPGNFQLMTDVPVTIAEGCTLTTGYICGFRSAVTVEGTLVNTNGVNIIHNDRFQGSLTIAEGGKYTGDGMIRVFIPGSDDPTVVLSGIDTSRFDIVFDEQGGGWILTPKAISVLASGTCGEALTWVLTDDGVLTISGEGAMYDYQNPPEVPNVAPWAELPVTSVVVESGVTGIGICAFRGLAITGVSLPDTIASIGHGAFDICTSLTEIQLPDGLTAIGDGAFSGCPLTELTIPASVSAIGNGTFSGCTQLKEINFLGDAPAIGNYTFSNVTATVYYPANNETWTEDVMQDYGGNITWVAYTESLPCDDGHHVPALDIAGDETGVCEYCGIPCRTSGGTIWAIEEDGTMYVYGNGEMYAHDSNWKKYADQVTALVVKEGVTGTIHGFDQFRNLESVSLPQGLARIEKGCFGGCTSLKQVNFPESLTEIGSNSFQGCVSLEEVRLPAGLKSFGARPFGGCTNLTGIWVDETNPWFTNDSSGVLFSKDMTQLIEAPGTLSGHYTIPETVNYIEWAAFDGCASLTGVDIPDGVTMLQMNLFENCTSLKSITIPASVTDVWIQVFMGCTGLETVIFEGDAPSLDNAFDGLTFTAYYPAGNDTWTEEVMLSANGTITWVAYASLEITQQPVDYVGMVGDTATFTVVAEGEGLKYQWYYYDTEASEWKKSSGNTSDSISVEFKAYRVNQEYRCEITDSDGNTVTTDVVKIVAKVVPLVITAHPAAHVGAVNDNVSMTVEATGNGLTYQWYYSTDGGVTWAKSGSPGFATANLQPILRAYRDGYKFYCLVTDIFGNTAQSDVASMTVKASEVVITKAPVDVKGAKLGELYYFEAEATGDNLEYRWEFSSDGGETWQLSWNQGYNTATLGVRMNANRDGYLYRCKITSGLKTVVYTEPVSLNLQEPSAVIVGQSGNVAIIANKTATFTVDAEGTDLSYLWYRSNDKGATWTQTYLSGYNTDTLSFVGTAARAAMYKCKITDGSGKVVWTENVKLQILSAELKILSQPESITCASGATAAFTVEAQGDGLKYQWYASSDGGATWTASYLGGYNTDTFSFAVNAARAAKLYKCVITDAGGNIVETNAVSVTIG